MNHLSIKVVYKSIGKLFLLFIAFQAFWFVLYFLSGSMLIKDGLWSKYFRQAATNSIGFICLMIAYFLLFPFYLSPKKYFRFYIITTLLIYTFGRLHYLANDWILGHYDKKEIAYTSPSTKTKSFPAISLMQPNGASVYAMLYITIYILLGLGFAYMRDNTSKEKKAKLLEKEKLQAELKLLRYQINPHFLFNTINDIYYLAIIQSDKTADALLQLSQILRYVLDERETSVSLAQEIDYLDKYIQLHLFRFPDEVIKRNFDLSYKDSQIKIAPLLLITFIENAFKHGYSGTAEAPTTVGINYNKNTLCYEVVNYYGTQISKEEATGIGLTNLKRRLELIYPNKHTIRLTKTENRFIATLKIFTNDYLYSS